MKLKEKTVTIKLVLLMSEKIPDHELAAMIEEAVGPVNFGKRMWEIGKFDDFRVTKIKTKNAK